MIRKATVDDAEILDQINRKVLPENYPLSFWIEHLEAPSTANFVIEEKENIVAYVLAVLHYDNKKNIEGHIYSIGVLPESRRKGYGQMLLEAAEKRLKEICDIRCVTLHVRKTNKGAITFYHKLGYMRSKKVKEYYGKNQDGFLMKKLLL